MKDSTSGSGTSSSFPYDVSLLPEHLSPEELVFRVASTLDHLSRVTDDVFARVANRVEDNRQQLAKINDRIALCQAKIDVIKESKKATQVDQSCEDVCHGYSPK